MNAASKANPTRLISAINARSRFNRFPVCAIKKEDDRVRFVRSTYVQYTQQCAQSSLVDPNAPSKAGPIPKFSITREVLIGRLASVGMFTAVNGEVITGRGPLGQLAMETGVGEGALLKIIAAVAAFNLILGLLPRSPTYSTSNQSSVEQRGRTAARELQQEGGLLWPLSLRNGGLNKRNELILGRSAMLLFVVALLVDAKWQQGPLVLLNLLPGGVPLREAPVYLPLLALPFLLAGIGAGDAEDA